MATSDAIALSGAVIALGGVVISLIALLVSWKAFRYARKSYIAQYLPALLAEWEPYWGFTLHDVTLELPEVVQQTQIAIAITNQSSNMAVSDVVAKIALPQDGKKLAIYGKPYEVSNIMPQDSVHQDRNAWPSLEEFLCAHVPGFLEKVTVEERRILGWRVLGKRGEEAGSGWASLFYFAVKKQMPILLELVVTYKPGSREGETLTVRKKMRLSPIVISTSQYPSALAKWEVEEM